MYHENIAIFQHVLIIIRLKCPFAQTKKLSRLKTETMSSCSLSDPRFMYLKWNFTCPNLCCPVCWPGPLMAVEVWLVQTGARSLCQDSRPHRLSQEKSNEKYF